MSILPHVRHQVEGCRFVARNLGLTRGMEAFPAAKAGDVTLFGLPPYRIDDLDHLHRELRDGRALNGWRRMLLRLRGSALCLVARDAADRLVAMEFFYFRQDEAAESVVHEAFIGVLRDYRGRGIATRMRRMSASHFAACGLKAISTQIERDNAASLRSAVAAGFSVVANADDRLQLRLGLGGGG